MRKPIKWFSVPQLFRYERQQRGRLREHFQLNLDIIGEEGVGADAELLAAAIDCLRVFGLSESDFVARVSDRRLLRALLLHAQVPEDRLTLVYNIVDKLERESREIIATRLEGEVGLGPAVVEEVLGIFQHRDLDALRDAYGATEIIGEELARINELFQLLATMGLQNYVRFDLSVVRGLAYYTGIVFELFDIRGELRAICGGGRYDDLLKVVSGNDLPALGFGMGDVVLADLLASRGLLPSVEPAIDYFLVAISEAERPNILELAQRLRSSGRSAEYTLRHQAVGKQLKAAAASGARRALMIGPEERAEGVVLVRAMETGDELRISVDRLIGE